MLEYQTRKSTISEAEIAALITIGLPGPSFSS